MNVRGSVHALWLLVLLFFASQQSLAQDNASTSEGPTSEWPTGRGGIESTGVATTTLAPPLALAWTYQPDVASPFEATPVISQGTAYLPDGEGRVHAVQLATGKPVWVQKHSELGYTAPGAVAGNRLFVADLDSQIAAIDCKTGEALWSFTADAEVYAGPIPTGDRVLITTEAGSCYALDQATGEVLWQFQIEAPLRCSATVVSGHVLLAGCDSQLHAVSVDSGQEVATVELGSQTGCTVATREGRSWFGTEGGELLAVDFDANKLSFDIAWRYSDPKRGQGIRTAVAVTASHLLFSNQARVLYALDPTTGELRWQQRLRSRAEASPLILHREQDQAGQTSDWGLLLTSRGRAQIRDMKSGDVAWEYDAGGSFLASPAVANNRLLLANTDGTLRCFVPAP